MKYMRLLIIMLDVILVGMCSFVSVGSYLENNIFKTVVYAFCALCWLGCAIINIATYRMENKSR